jgi:acyl dehydratase
MSTLAARRLPARLLGVESAPLRQRVDSRWLMAYAAGLGDSNGRFYDTLTPAGPVAHPLFAVCYEWPPLVALRESLIGEDLAPFSVHATHDLVISRMPRAGEDVTTSARVVAIERRRSGTLVVARLMSLDDAGRVLTTTDYGSVYRGVEPAETGRIAEPFAPVAAIEAKRGDPQTPRWTEPLGVSAGAAHVYTECARIWNPIHTDVAVARAAGLPATILHGTATLALAVSRVVAREMDGDAARVRRVRARFTGYVRVPSTLTVRCRGRTATTVAFDAMGPDGASVLGEGVLST